MATPHSTSNYIPAGKGILYIAEWSGTTPPTDPTDYVEIGNCPSLEIEPAVEKRPHYSSREGMRMKDLNPIVQAEYSVNFECDEIAAENLARFFMGTYNSTTGKVTAMTSIEKEFALKFVSNNPAGPEQIFNMWRVSIAPNGPLQLIGDDYLVMSFAGEGLSDSTNHADSPYFDIKYITTTSTSTTTTTA